MYNLRIKGFLSFTAERFLVRVQFEQLHCGFCDALIYGSTERDQQVYEEMCLCVCVCVATTICYRDTMDGETAPQQKISTIVRSYETPNDISTLNLLHGAHSARRLVQMDQ